MDKTWGKNKRLLKRAEFSHCYDKGQKLHSRYFLAFIASQETEQSKVGFAVSKKKGNAVVRNKVKRLLREFCRLNQHFLPQFSSIVLIPKKHIKIENFNYKEVEEELHKLFKKSHENS